MYQYTTVPVYECYYCTNLSVRVALQEEVTDMMVTISHSNRCYLSQL